MRFAATGSHTPDLVASEWSLSGGTGEQRPRADDPSRPVYRVTDDGNDMNYWHTNGPIEPGKFYGFDFRYRRTDGEGKAGAVIAGPAAVNRDFPCDADQWRKVGFVFMTPMPSS